MLIAGHPRLFILTSGPCLVKPPAAGKAGTLPAWLTTAAFRARLWISSCLLLLLLLLLLLEYLAQCWIDRDDRDVMLGFALKLGAVPGCAGTIGLCRPECSCYRGSPVRHSARSCDETLTVSTYLLDSFAKPKPVGRDLGCR